MVQVLGRWELDMAWADGVLTCSSQLEKAEASEGAVLG